MKVDEIRERFLAFFETKGHVRQESDVLVPTWDPSVLFTPAGMNQFKDHFLGKVKLDFTRATTSQKCLRTGDIENVGRTAYHHTFFEMLGNFSFGDYFKADAINWAWEFLTSPEWMNIDKQRLTVSVYLDDDEAASIWHEQVGLETSRIERMGEDDNFWPAGAPSQGPDGVCGPCSEIFYTTDSGVVVEIWNLVFTQFNRVGEPPDNLRSLPSKNIDTGMGLERIAAVMQGVDTNYHIDTLLPLVEAAGEICSTSYDREEEGGRRLRRISDHVRACVFSIHENVYPGANKEKYVIRRLLRRAVLDGHQLGLRDPFLYQLVPVVADLMKHPYPELSETVDRVAGVIKQEENAFFGTIDAGLNRIDSIFSSMQANGQVIVDGASAADLYQTYGVPPELVESMASEQEFSFDWDGFRAAMDQHGVNSGKNQFELFKTGPVEQLKRTIQRTDFVGYESTRVEATVKGIIDLTGEGQLVESCQEEGQEVVVILDRSPFYGEAGGQVGDSGSLQHDDFQVEVVDTQRDGELLLHHGRLLSGTIQSGETVTAEVDEMVRDGIRRAHSATHVLHYALQKELGSHAQQQGSKVDDDVLRFDFTNLEPVSAEQLAQIEKDVIERVERGEQVQWNTVPLAEARASGAMMLFGEKYPDPVRVVSMGEFSQELCGGTHLENTAGIGSFEVISEEGVAAGTRRITALTGEKAAAHARQVVGELEKVTELLGVAAAEVPEAARQLASQVRELKKRIASGGGMTDEASGSEETSGQLSENDYLAVRTTLRETARLLNVGVFDVSGRLSSLHAEIVQLREELEQMKSSAQVSADELLEMAEDFDSARGIIQLVEGSNPDIMRRLIDQLRKKEDSVAVLLATASGEDKVVLVAGVTRDLVDRGVHAGNWVAEVARVVGGGGGGRPDMAQAGGKDPSKLEEALDHARQQLVEMLS
ncbi:MAG: alanine--tRNA ligase [Planctomycetaceae bacterium]|nr:alanine--tRNA ligase [Planctomycetaceae bacterium]